MLPASHGRAGEADGVLSAEGTRGKEMSREKGRIKSKRARWLWFGAAIGWALLSVTAPLPALAAKKAATGKAASSAGQKESGGECGNGTAAGGQTDDLQLPPGVVSPLSRVLPEEGGCYEPLRVTGGKNRRCEPQCIPYIRCRSGIDSCRIGIENGPLTWFACEAQRGNTAPVPQPGSVLILAANSRRKMPTGHGLYVEDVIETAPSLYRLVLSHTNFDRRCSIETNIEATYDLRQRTVDFLSGAWQAWGQDLGVAGFILGREAEQTNP